MSNSRDSISNKYRIYEARGRKFKVLYILKVGIVAHGTCGDAGVVGRRGWASERVTGSRGKARSKESLRKHSVKYELKYERKKINSNIKSFIPEHIN